MLPPAVARGLRRVGRGAKGALAGPRHPVAEPHPRRRVWRLDGLHGGPAGQETGVRPGTRQPART
eukprot:scaffold152462_cov32-Prasinocladus_malaysianus.AAC.1